MRSSLQLLLALCSSAVLLSCGGADADLEIGEPVCSDALERVAWGRYDPGAQRECTLRGAPSGLVVLLPSAPWDRSWVLTGTAGDESFACTFVPGMTDADLCSEEPRANVFSAGVRIVAHPCDLALRLEVEGEHVASASFTPEYAWTEPNGPGCGWSGQAVVELAPDAG